MAGYQGSSGEINKHTGISYQPSDLGHLSGEGRRKYELFYRNLCKYREGLAPNLKQKIPDAQMRELALSLLDDTVFDIVQELEDIQSLSERQLLNKRMRVVGHHKSKKLQMNKKQREDIAKCWERPHHLPVLEQEHDKEKAVQERRLAEEVKMTDQEVILELDQIVSNQQTTLSQAAVPFFFVTNNPQDIQVQIHILRFIQKLSQLQDTDMWSGIT